MNHYILIFKHRKGKDLFTTKHRFMFFACLFAKRLKRKGFVTLALLHVHNESRHSFDIV